MSEEIKSEEIEETRQEELSDAEMTEVAGGRDIPTESFSLNFEEIKVAQTTRNTSSTAPDDVIVDGRIITAEN